MAIVNISNVSNLNDSVLDLRYKVTSSLTTNINNAIQSLNNVNNYSNNGFGANVGYIATTIANNLNNVLTNISNAQENFFNYASYINQFNTDDYNFDAKPVDLKAQYNALYLKNGTNDNDLADENSNKKNEKERSTSDYSSLSSNFTVYPNVSEKNDINGSLPTNQLENYLDSIPGKTIITNSSLQVSASTINIQDNNIDPHTLAIMNNANYNEEGFAMFNDRYIIKTPSSYGNIGDFLDFKQTDGTLIKCIIGEHQTIENSTINFIVNSNTFNGSVATLHPNWLQSIVSVNNKGNLFDYLQANNYSDVVIN